MPLDEHGLEVIRRAEARALLTTRRVARLGVSIDALPVIVPVFYAVDGNFVVLRSKEGTPVDKALTDCIVCVEVDTLHETGNDFGWGVVVTGYAERVDDADEIARMETLGVPDLIEGTHWVRIPTDMILGRRLLTPS